MDLETQDPVAALGAKEIHSRCAGARDLSKMGRLEDIPALVERAQGDKSPAVRLCAAGAVADILSRHRTGRSLEVLPVEERERLLDLFKVIDPSVNAGLFSMLACLDLSRSFSRIATGLRDPRGDVRVGAAVGLMRLCISEAHLGDRELERQVVELLDDRRLKPDALAEVARVCAAAGYLSALPRLRRLDVGESAHAGFIAEVVRSMEELEGPPVGAWVSDGRDAGEVNPEPARKPATLLVFEDGGAVLAEQGDTRLQLVEAFSEDGFRRMYFRRVGQQKPDQALQALERTWYRADPGELVESLDTALDLEALDWATGGPAEALDLRLASGFAPTLGETGAEQRIKAILLIRAARPEQARAALEHAITLKKLPPDTWFFLGEARAAIQDEAGAREAWDNAARKAKRKKDWYAIKARERLGEAP